MMGMDDIVLSVIVPVYNAERYLSECLDSLTGQSCPAMEIVVVDDGSTDNSGAICDGFGARDSRVRVFHRENGGVSRARNFGLDNARGELVVFVDADDSVSPDYADMITGTMPGQDMVCFQSEWVSLSGGRTCHMLPVMDSGADGGVDDAIMAVKGCNDDGANLLGFPWNKAFRRDIIERNGIRFNPLLRYKEDEVFVLEYLKHVSSIKIIPQILYNYRLLGNGLTSGMRRLGSKDWRELWQSADRARGRHTSTGRCGDSVTYDVLNWMFMEAYCLFKEGGDWSKVMKAMCCYYDSLCPGEVKGQEKVKLSLKYRNRCLWRLFFAALRMKKY